MPRKSKYSRSRSRSTYKSLSRYSKPIKKTRKYKTIKKSVGSRLGRIVGSMTPLGGHLGSQIGKGIASVFGHGDYSLGPKPYQNTLVPGDDPPQFSTNNRVTCVKHREYIQDINSSIGFQTQALLSINPGLEGTFPWLSSVGANYECYRIKGMLFEFKSLSADALNSTNTALGSVIMATQYNAADAAFITKQQMENYEFAQSCKPSQSMLHYVECAKYTMPLNELYIRIGAVPTGQSAQLYDIGLFQLATVGMQAVNTIGELWVTYDIEFLKPKLVQGQYGNNLNYAHLQLGLDNGTANIFPTDSIVQPSTNLPLLYSSTILNVATITFPSYITAGNYQVEYMVYGTTAAAMSGPSIAATFNCNGLQLMKNNTIAGVKYVISATGTAMISNFFFTVTGPSAILTFNTNTSAWPSLSDTGGDVIITQINGLAF